MTLPKAPPSTQLMAKQNKLCPACCRSSQTIKPAAPKPSAVKNQRCQPEASAKKENAAPLLCARTRLKKLVTGSLAPSCMLPMMSSLLNWSARMMISAIASQCSMRMPPLPPRAIRRPAGTRPRRTGCSRSVRTRWGVPGRCPHPSQALRHSASSARTWPLWRRGC